MTRLLKILLTALITITLIMGLAINFTACNTPETLSGSDSIVPIGLDSNYYTRFNGVDRYDTSLKIVQSGWSTSDYAVLTTGEDFPDALSSGPLAKKYNAPILLTNPDELNSSIEQEIATLKVKTIFIIGGYGAVSKTIEDKLISKGIKCIRIQGVDRYQTAIAVANYLGKPSQVFITIGSNYVDTLSIASYASFKQIPILLVEKDYMPTGVLNYINSNDITKVYVIGGPAVISDVTVKDLPNVERIYGQDRYETNTIVMSKFKSEFDFTNIYYATPNNFPDALSGAALAAKTNSPIILIDNNTSNFTLKFISDVLSKIRMRYILGGTGVLSDDLMNSILN